MTALHWSRAQTSIREREALPVPAIESRVAASDEGGLT